MHGEETWEFLRDAHVNSARGRLAYKYKNKRRRNTRTTQTSPQRRVGFNVEVEIRDDGPRGRSVYAARPIPKGTKVYDGDNVVHFDRAKDLVTFLKLLPHDLQCDVLLWAFPSGSKGRAYVALDEGSFVNHGEDPRLVTLDKDCRTVRDVEAGEELLEDYGEFVSKTTTPGKKNGWFSEIRGMAWGDEEERGSTKIEKYVSLGAPELRRVSGDLVVHWEFDDDDGVFLTGGRGRSSGGWTTQLLLFIGALICLVRYRRQTSLQKSKDKSGL